MPHTKLRMACGPLDVHLNSRGAGTALAFHCCFVFLICMMRGRFCCSIGNASAGGTPSDGAIKWIQPRTCSLACKLCPDIVPNSLNLRIRVLVVPFAFHPQLECADSILQVQWYLAAVPLVHNASSCPGELHVMTWFCETGHNKYDLLH